MANDSKTPDIRKTFRFAVDFADFFREGLYQMGPVRPDLEYTGNPDRPGPQKRDELTGALVWKATVSDPGERNARRASYEVLLLSDTEPEPTTPEIAPGIRPIALTEVTVQPRVGGQGEFKYLTYTVRATGYATPPGSGNRSAGSSGAGKTAA
ncbi:hypothetical protein [Nocardia gamkensis]|uniref:hypothetical protein n=1 Tax=Nocardia gamkensis TaxID=352869 RepID=UPI0037CC9582